MLGGTRAAAHGCALGLRPCLDLRLGFESKILVLQLPHTGVAGLPPTLPLLPSEACSGCSAGHSCVTCPHGVRALGWEGPGPACTLGQQWPWSLAPAGGARAGPWIPGRGAGLPAMAAGRPDACVFSPTECGEAAGESVHLRADAQAGGDDPQLQVCPRVQRLSCAHLCMGSPGPDMACGTPHSHPLHARTSPATHICRCHQGPLDKMGTGGGGGCCMRGLVRPRRPLAAGCTRQVSPGCPGPAALQS